MSANLKIATRLTLGFGAILLLLASATGLALRDVGVVETELRDIVRGNGVKEKRINEMSESAQAIARAIRAMVAVDARPATVEEKRRMLEEARRRFDEVYAALSALPASSHDRVLRARLDAATQAAHPLAGRIAGLAPAYRNATARDLLAREAMSVTGAWHDALRDMSTAQEAEAAASRAQARAAVEAAWATAIWLMAASLLVAVAGALCLVRMRYGSLRQRLPRPGKRPPVTHSPAENLSFTTTVGGMAWLLLAILTLSLPAIYLMVHLQYQHGQIDAESGMNAESVSGLLAQNRGTLEAGNEALRKLVDNHIHFKGGGNESQAIVTTDGRKVFAKDMPGARAWPVISHRSPIVADGNILGYFVVTRSLGAILRNAIAIFAVSLLSSGLIALLLQRLVLRRIRNAEKELSHHARFDPLTGLPNRREVIKALQGRLTAGPHMSTAVFFIDLDKFKSLNDSFGHAFGDQMLLEVASMLEGCLRPNDLLGRLRGDEFVILVSFADGETPVERVRESIVRAFSVPRLCLGREIAITATVGIAISPEHGDDAERLLQHADTAMHALKSRRRNGWAVYDASMTDRLNREMHLRMRLGQALQREEFELHYQPLFNLKENCAIGAEALLRWRDPETGMLVLPAEFIPELEQSGMIVPVGEWVLRTACRQIAQWRTSRPGFHMAINVSARQFIEEGFVDSVARILSEEKVEPNAIEIELTESMLSDEILTNKRLAQLKAIGVRLALDDFGTGFSSLGRLASMPFDVIKIDRQFISRMAAGPREQSVIVSILALSRGLGMTTLSEGIENAEQLETLVELDCERCQGFLFSRPVPSERFEATYVGGGNGRRAAEDLAVSC